MTTTETVEHTPAPWSITPGQRLTLADEPGIAWATVAIHGPDKSELASIDYESQVHTETAHANALLIAAAPDLLAACRKALTWFDTHDREAPCYLQYEALRAAIAKVEGEERAK